MLIAVALSAVACGKVNDDAWASASDAGLADADADVRGELAMRDDGCPVSKRDLSLPCAVGKVCKYYDDCQRLGGSCIDQFVCEVPFEQPMRWRADCKPCWSEKGPDGCPLGSMPAGPQWCTEPGKTCVYSSCSYNPSGITVTYSCRAWEAGFIFQEDSRIKCAGTDASP